MLSDYAKLLQNFIDPTKRIYYLRKHAKTGTTNGARFFVAHDNRIEEITSLMIAYLNTGIHKDGYMVTSSPRDAVNFLSSRLYNDPALLKAEML
jgi:hypothetical protein